jgi:hypothetical protein
MRKSISPLIILALACTAFAQTTPDVVAISAEDIAIVNALGQSLQQHQKEVQAAIAKQESRLCAEAHIQREACLVDWQKSIVGVKPKEAPKPADATAK